MRILGYTQPVESCRIWADKIYCLTLDEALQCKDRFAVKYHQQEIDDKEKGEKCIDKLLGIVVRELPVGFDQLDSETEHFYRWWLFDRDGVLIDSSKCMDTALRSDHWPVFLGRKESDIRFKEGDIVAIHMFDEMILGFIVNTPHTAEEGWYRWKNASNYAKRVLGFVPVKDEDKLRTWFWDESDDTYTTCSGPSYDTHGHEVPCNVFAPPFPLPEELIAKIKNDYIKLKND